MHQGQVRGYALEQGQYAARCVRQRAQRRWLGRRAQAGRCALSGQGLAYFRADAGFANPEVYEFLEAEQIKSRPARHAYLVRVIQTGCKPKIHCARSISRQRPTPWTAGIGPLMRRATRRPAPSSVVGELIASFISLQKRFYHVAGTIEKKLCHWADCPIF